MTKPPFAPIDYAPVRVDARRTADGGWLLTSPAPLEPYEPSLGAMLRRQAAATPDRFFLAEREAGGGWRTLSYGAARQQADQVAQALLDRGLGPERPLAILSGNAIDHALLMLGGFVAGVPVVPVSVAYSLMSQDFAKLRHIVRLVRPGLVYAASGAAFARAIGALDLAGAEVVASVDAEAVGGTPFAALTATTPTPAVEHAYAAVGPDTVAKVLFTSGSTGLPKGVVNTHRMLCANQQMMAQAWRFLAETPPVLVDWLPWNHTFGGNHDFNLVLRHGGTLYIDAGKPAPGLFAETVRNLAEVGPTIIFNVPAGYSMLLGALEKDDALCRAILRRLQLIFYAGAALPQDLWERLEAVAVRTLGRRVPMTSSWGLTETAPAATTAHYLIERAGVVGVPLPGVTVKLVPTGTKLELRVKGPNVTTGYFNDPKLTAEAFDEHGFYCTGDAGRLADPDHPAKGLLFDGRTAEDFKLLTGTWVHVGGLRVAALAAASPVLQDAVVTGHDRDRVGLLAWPNLAACRELCGQAVGPDDVAALLRDPVVVARVRDGLAAWNARQSGSSTRIARVLLMAEPPSIDANEITDKGYINQRATLERRHATVERLHADPPGPEVIVVGEPPPADR